jgi:hypothetical protein
VTPERDLQRFERTIEKMRRGELPRPADDVREISAGADEPCSGCGELITHAEPLHKVTVRGLVSMRFHEICFTAWESFRQHP